MKQMLILFVVLAIAILGFFLLRAKSVSKMTTPIQQQTTQDDKTTIQKILQQQVPQRGGVQKFDIVELKIEGNFARATLKPLDIQTDNAMVFLEKKNGSWTIIWGPGTGLNPNDPQVKDVPKDLLQ